MRDTETRNWQEGPEWVWYFHLCWGLIVIFNSSIACREQSVEQLLGKAPTPKQAETLRVDCEGLTLSDCQNRARGQVESYPTVLYVDTAEARAHPYIKTPMYLEAPTPKGTP